MLFHSYKPANSNVYSSLHLRSTIYPIAVTYGRQRLKTKTSKRRKKIIKKVIVPTPRYTMTRIPKDSTSKEAKLYILPCSLKEKMRMSK